MMLNLSKQTVFLSKFEGFFYFLIKLIFSQIIILRSIVF